MPIYEEDGIQYLDNGVYTTSAIDPKNPTIPPLEYQHDLICGALQKSPPGRLLQVGVGFGALAYAFDELGYRVDALDVDLTNLYDYQSRVNFIESYYQEYSPIRSYDVIVIDMCSPFHQSSWYTDGVFNHALSMLKVKGLIVFNTGPWLHYSHSILTKVVNTFTWYSMVPTSSVLLCSNVSIDCTVPVEYPDWLIKGSQLHQIKP